MKRPPAPHRNQKDAVLTGRIWGKRAVVGKDVVLTHHDRSTKQINAQLPVLEHARRNRTPSFCGNGRSEEVVAATSRRTLSYPRSTHY